MRNEIEQRLPRVETLETRAVLAAQAFLSLDFPVSNFAINSPLSTTSTAAGHYRQISTVVDNEIRTLALHPQATSLGLTTQAMSLPAEAVDANIERAWDADTGSGFALTSHGQTTAVVWLSAETTIALGNVVPLAGYQRADGSIVVAFESNPSLRIARYALDGTELNSVSLDGEIYSSAQATPDGMVIMGTENELPIAAWIDENFQVTEAQLSLPSGANFAAPIGVSLNGSQRLYTGSVIDGTGMSRLIFWDMQGNEVVQAGFDNLWAVKAVGRAILVDTDNGPALVLRDAALADLMEIPADVPVIATDLKVLQGRGLTTMSLTDVIERDGELFLGVVATDANGQLLHGLISATTDAFPSPWQNVVNPLDVNRSGVVTPLDALLVINELNAAGARVLALNELDIAARVDVNGDGVVSPLDALLVINFLNNSAAAESESFEALAVEVDSSVDLSPMSNPSVSKFKAWHESLSHLI